MSLQGTFDTLPVTELLGLLVRARKTGVLRLETDSAEGRLWLVSGRCRAVESGEQTGPAGTPGELQERLADVCFAAAHRETGSFRFADGEEPPWPTAYDVAVEDAVAEVHRRLDEWDAIRSVVPSLDHRPRLRPELEGPPITLDAEQWRLLVALDGRRSVRDVVHRTERSVLDVCRAVKDLVERGAVEVAGARGDRDEVAPEEPAELAPAEAASVVAREPAPSGPGAAARMESAPSGLAAVATMDAAPAEAAAEATPAEMQIAGLEELAELAGLAGAAQAPARADPAPAGADRKDTGAAEQRAEADRQAEPVSPDAQTPQMPQSDPSRLLRAVRIGEGAAPPAPPAAVPVGATVGAAVAPAAVDIGAAAAGPLPPTLPGGPPGEEAVRDRGALLRLFSALRDS